MRGPRTKRKRLDILGISICGRNTRELGLTPAQIINEKVVYFDEFFVKQKAEKILARHQNFFVTERESPERHTMKSLPLRIPIQQNRPFSETEPVHRPQELHKPVFGM